MSGFSQSLVWASPQDRSFQSRYGGNALPSELIALEPRVMLDGAAMAAAVAEADANPADNGEANQDDNQVDPPAAVHNTESEAPQDASGAGNSGATVVIIDAAVDNPEALLVGIDPSADIYYLGGGTDGIQQITAILSNYSNVSGLHILSHGTTGAVTLGSSIINSLNLESYAADFVRWDAALTDGADILFYGCNVGQDGSGNEFISLVSELTNADVAASNDVTGHETLGGDWDLEVAAGDIQTAGIVTDAGQAAFNGTLASFTETFDTIDTVLGSESDTFTTITINGFTFALTSAGNDGMTNPNVAAGGDEEIVNSTFAGGGTAETVTMTAVGGGSFIFNSIQLNVQLGANVTVTALDAGGGVLATMATTGLGTQTLDFGAVTGVSSVTIDFPASGIANFDDVETGDPGNMPPTAANIPTDVTVTEDLASNFDLSAVVFADAEGDNLTVTLAATAGTFAATSGGSVTVGGTGTATLTLTGSVANINTYLDTVTNIQYTGAADANGDDAAMVSVNANDGTSNPVLGTINIDITAVNDAPTAAGIPTDITVVEDTASNFDLSAITFADVDGDNLTVTLTASAGTFAAIGAGGVIVGGTGTGTLTLAGTAANINTFLNTITNVQYTGAADVNGNDAATVTVNVNDGTVNPQLGTINVDITPANDAPTVAGVPSDVTVTEDTASNFDISAITFTDIDGDNLTVTLTASSGTFAATSGGSVTVGGSGTDTLTLAGTAANINAFLDTVTNIQYTGAANVSGDDAATVAVNVNDGTVNPQLGTINVDITAVNDAPTAAGIPTDITVVEDTASNFDLSAITFADVDGDNLTVTLTASAGTFAAIGAGGVIVGGTGTGTLTLAGTAANINTFLNTITNVQYTGAADVNGNDAATVTVNVNDGTVNPQLGTINVDITTVNDPPLIANLAGDTATVIAAGAAANIDVGGNALVTDPDGAIDFNGGFIVFDITAGTDNGTFSFDGVNVLSGGDTVIAANETITVGGVAVGVVSNVAGQDGQGGNLLRIDFSAAANPATISTLIQNLLYAAPSGFGDRTLTTTIEDGDGTANGGDSDTIIVSTINVPVAPQVQSIVRQAPVGTDTNADTVTFLVTFDSDVVGVDVSDFALSGTLAGASTVTTVTPVSGSAYEVIVDVPDAGDGTINLDISATPTVQNGGGVNLQNSAIPIGADETYTIDNTAPAVPTIDLSASSDTNINNDDITSDTTPTFTGVVEAGSTVTLSSSIDGEFVQGTAAAYGAAGLTPIAANALSDGVHTITVTSTDAAGNTSMANLTVTIDTTAPVLNAFTRSAPTGAQTNADTLVFQATFNETVNGVDAADFAVNGTTTATVTNVVQTSPTTFLVTVSGGDLATFDGAVNLNVAGGAVITDVAGNALAFAEPATDETFTLDNTAPNPPAGLDLQAASDTGVSNTDNLTADTTPTIGGTAEPDATVTLTSNRDGVVGIVTANAAGVWTITTNVLSEGVHSLTATATDATGNISAASVALAVTIDITANAPTAPDLTAASDTGTSNTDNETSDTTPTLTGTAEAGSTVTLISSISGAVGTAVADAAGAWSITSTTLPEGVHVFTAFMTDRAGNISPASTATIVTISTSTGQVSTGTDGSDIGGLGSGNDGPSNGQSDNPFGDGSDTGGPGNTFGAGTPFGTGPQTSENGAGPLAPGRASVDDIITGGIGGNNPFPGTGISDGDLPGTIVLHPSSDTGFSNSDNTTRDNTPTLTGEAPANTIVTITSSLGGILGTANVDENGKWTFTAPSLSDGIHELIATPKDENGNEGTPSLPLLATIDTVAPQIPSAPEFVGDIDQLRSDDTPTFKGKAEPGARVILSSDPDGIVGEVIADENGNWQVTTDPLSENTHALSVTATDTAGNISTSSPGLDLVVRGEDDTALNFDQEFPVRSEITRADGSMTFDVAALLSGFSPDVVSTGSVDDVRADREPSSALGFTRQLQKAGNNRSEQMFV